MENRDYEKIRHKMLEAGIDSCHAVLYVDLLQDRCTAVRSGPDGWQPEEGSLSGQLEQLARSGAVHPQDQEAFAAFTRLEHMRSAARLEQEALLYRRSSEEGWRWHLMELVPEQDGRSAVLLVRDLTDALGDSWARIEGSARELQQQAQSQRDTEMAAILRSRFRTMNTVDVESGRCRWLELARPSGTENTGDYAHFIQNEVSSHVHPDDVGNFWKLLSLDHLRETVGSLDGDYKEEVCLYRRREGPLCWIEQRIIYSRQGGRVAVNILGQDVTKEKCREENRIRDLEERASIISSLSTLFFSTYYVDLEHDTFRAVTQLSHVGDLLGAVVQCSAALQIYANHFIHPDDRAEYLRVMDVQNLRQKLRWWKPYVAVEYRKIGEREPWSWVRATAVLALSDADDMPKTAVYVAQDITEGQRKAGQSEDAGDLG